MKESRKLKYILYAFSLLLIIGIVGYMLLLDVDFVDAFYMTVITISTVGFGEVGTTIKGSEIFSICMIFLGVGIVGYAFTTIVAMFVEGKVSDLWKGNKMERKISALSDHYIICGSGELAEVIINKFLDENLNFVVITDNREDLDNLYTFFSTNYSFLGEHYRNWLGHASRWHPHIYLDQGLDLTQGS